MIACVTSECHDGPKSSRWSWGLFSAVCQSARVSAVHQSTSRSYVFAPDEPRFASEINLGRLSGRLRVTREAGVARAPFDGPGIDGNWARIGQGILLIQNSAKHQIMESGKFSMLPVDQHIRTGRNFARQSKRRKRPRCHTSR